MNDIPIDILYTDDEIVVAVKPSGIDSQSSANGSDMVSALRLLTGGEIYPVHRLDRETRGVMVYAKTGRAAAALSDSFSHGGTEKYYLAVLLGEPEQQSGEYRDLLYHDARRNKSYVVTCQRRGVRDAHLRYRVASSRGGASLVAVRLFTGRTHQIRVQFAYRGTPVLGDRRYGGKPDEGRWGGGFSGFRGIALACVSLAFPHPKTGEVIGFEHIPTGEPWDGFDISSAVSQLALLK